jgi:ABC-2 type transport system ATP-binding protein
VPVRPSSHHAVLAEGLRKRYGRTTALDGFDLAVAPGTVLGLLGPNGAGKTTAVRVLTTLLLPDGGRAEVAGFDVVRQAAQVRYHVGLVGQHAAVDEILGGRQNLVMFGRLYHLPPAAARRRADELLERFGLAGDADKPARLYSGGMRRRLDLAASLIVAPPVLFLDEPTTGLDPRGRNEVWQAIRALAAGGTTVLLTTQYLDEADRLADRIAVIDHGRVISEGTPGQLKASVSAGALQVRLRHPQQRPQAQRLLTAGLGVPVHLESDEAALSARVADADRVAEALAALSHAGVAVSDFALGQPSLDEVFLALTGHPTKEDAA